MTNLLAQVGQAAGAAVSGNNNSNINLKPAGGLVANVSGLTLSNLVGGFINLALVVAALIFFFMLVFGGVQWILSGGDKGATEAARGRITAALIGLVIVFAAWAIASLVGNLFGVSIFSLDIPALSTFQ